MNYRKPTNIRVEIIDPLTDSRWDRFVEKHPFGWVCHLSGWKRFLEDTFAHIEGHYITLLDESMNEIQAALPVYEVRSPLLGNRLVSIPFATLFDPLVSTKEELNTLLKETLALFESRKFSHLEIRAFSTSSFFTDSSFTAVKFYKHHFIYLDKDLEQLKRSFHRTCVRQRISRALKSDLKLVIGETESELRKFYKLYLVTRKRRCLPPQPYLFFKNLWRIFHKDGKIVVLLAQKNKHISAGLILLKYKNRVSAEYAASDKRYDRVSPNHFLFWTAIKIAHEEGFKIFDFGRTAPTNNTLMDFKRRWGTKIIDLPQFVYPKKAINEVKTNEKSWKFKLITKICKLAPDSCLQFLGNFCYKHLG